MNKYGVASGDIKRLILSMAGMSLAPKRSAFTEWSIVSTATDEWEVPHRARLPYFFPFPRPRLVQM